ncbi:alpha/beta fold hydrolase [Sphingomonas daechungensis]|uniref:Alpha/beta fold hydrolase n=1 Tax=Sphingomonas daechungensis TaxID=1176646 RepID=A0ABX6T4L1_9SPHN|nr:alpha/beta fold hydrolase [Sphingomonas daechungensis]
MRRRHRDRCRGRRSHSDPVPSRGRIGQERLEGPARTLRSASPGNRDRLSGYGESAFLPDATREDFARAAWAALDALDIDEAHVCGLSLGGVVAIAMHAAAPDRCRSLIIADSFAAHPQGQAIYDRSIAASSDMRGLAEARIGALMANQDPTVRGQVIETMSRIDPEAYRLGARAVWLADQRERAAAIRTPTLVICGDEDAITPPALSEELANLIPGAALDIIAGASHLANLDKPAEFNAAIDAFLARIETR